MGLKIVEIDGKQVVQSSSGYVIPATEYKSLKQDFVELILEKKEAYSLESARDELFKLGKAVPVNEVLQVEKTPPKAYTALANGTSYVDHMKAEITAANESCPPGEGGGYLIASQHAEIQVTAHGTVIVLPDCVLDFATALKSALRTVEPLNGKTITLNLALIASLKKGPGDE